MKSIKTFLILALLGVGCMLGLEAKLLPTDISQKEKPATLKILLKEGVSKANVEAKGRFYMYNISNNLPLDQGVFGKKGELMIACNGLKWGDHTTNVTKIRLVPGDSQSSILVDGIQYKGCIDFYTFGKTLTIVNELDIENYLRATLTPKIQERLPAEVIESLAIVARTNAYYFLQSQGDKLWHISAQAAGYQGYALSFRKPFIEKGIDKTRHIIMTFEGKPFPAYWSENSAGSTTTFSAVFRKEALVPPGIKTPYAEYERENHKWAFALTKNELAELSGAEKVTGVDLFCDSGSNKVYAMRIKDGGEVHDIPFTKLQALVGEKRLKSNDFTVTSKRDGVIFKGYGKGLGMGLCLLSAKKMADRGDKSPKILKTFFPGVEIIRERTYSNPSP